MERWDSRRGQLALIAGIVLAVAFVTLALIVNTVIFTENTATRDGRNDASDVFTGRQEAELAVADTLGRVNDEHATSHGALYENLTETVDERGQIVQRDSAAAGVSETIEVVSVENRTDVIHTNSSRNFTDESGDADWTLASDVRAVSHYRMRVQRDALALVSGALDPFRVVVDDGGSTWTMEVANDSTSDQILVTVTDGHGNTDSCAASGEDAWINVTEGTVGGTDCAALDFADGVTTPYSVRYENADNARGRYELGPRDATFDAANYDQADGSPRTLPQIHSVTVRYRYRSPDLEYDTTIEVVDDA